MDRYQDVKENAPTLWSLPSLGNDAHKYSRGHALVWGGAELTGASRLAALAAARTGAGLVTLAAPRQAWAVYASSLLSVMVRDVVEMHVWQQMLDDTRVRAVCIGPGAGLHHHTREAILAAYATSIPLVLDADALSLLASEVTLRHPRSNMVLTPHEGEYAKLATALRLDQTASKKTSALAMAQALGCVVVLKGAETIIANVDGRVVTNHAKAPWLATAGTGDVLAGMIAGLLAQGMERFDAACAAVWLHSEAARGLGRGMLAEDLLGQIPVALRKAAS